MEKENHIPSDTSLPRPSLNGGDILISSPLLQDPNFKRSAVLILQRDSSGGHLGLVLNQPLQLSLNEVCHMPGPEAGLPLFGGGPVDMQRLFWVHTLGEQLPDSVEVLPGLWVGGNYETLMERFATGRPMKDHIRFYLGYSGWSPDQLEKEIDAGAWVVLSNFLDPGMLIRSSADRVWPDLVRNLGPSYRHWLMLPPHPSLN